MTQLTNLLKFGLVAVLGLSIDLMLYMILYSSRVPVLYSSASGSFAAVLFVYYASQFIFIDNIRPRDKNGLVAWLGYQALSIGIFSAAVHNLYSFKFSAVEAKLLTIPISFLCNYIVIKIIHSPQSKNKLEDVGRA